MRKTFIGTLRQLIFKCKIALNLLLGSTMSETLKLENQLCHRFYLLSNAFTRAYRPLLQKLDVTYSQYLVLMALWEQDDITIASLLQKTGIDGGAMSPILKRLTQKEYLTVEKDQNDKRVKWVKLTKQGNSLKQEAEPIPTQMMCKLNNMSLEQAKELIETLDTLKACLVETD